MEIIQNFITASLNIQIPNDQPSFLLWKWFWNFINLKIKIGFRINAWNKLISRKWIYYLESWHENNQIFNVVFYCYCVGYVGFDQLLHITVEGEVKPIGVTDNHPIWSEDRQELRSGQFRAGWLPQWEVQRRSGLTSALFTSCRLPWPL